MVSKMQLRSVGEMCPGYVQAHNISWTLAAKILKKRSAVKPASIGRTTGAKSIFSMKYCQV